MENTTQKVLTEEVESALKSKNGRQLEMKALRQNEKGKEKNHRRVSKSIKPVRPIISSI